MLRGKKRKGGGVFIPGKCSLTLFHMIIPALQDCWRRRRLFAQKTWSRTQNLYRVPVTDTVHTPLYIRTCSLLFNSEVASRSMFCRFFSRLYIRIAGLPNELTSSRTVLALVARIFANSSRWFLTHNNGEVDFAGSRDGDIGPRH